MGKRGRETGAQAFMNPIWSPEAIADLPALWDYIAQEDPAAAQRVALHIIRNVEALLPNSPESGGRNRLIDRLRGSCVARAIRSTRFLVAPLPRRRTG